MWPSRRRSPVGDNTLPKKVFISHSYQDTGAREQLLKVLPTGVEPFVFPPITVAPEEMVSDKLLDAIRACDGLVYVQEGASADSFWVALERDYALRIGKPVFAFTPSTASLSRDSSAALTMKVFLWYSMPHVKTAERLADMLRQRYIEPWLDIQGNHPAYEKLAPALQARGLEVTPENVQRLAVENIARAREQAQNEGAIL